MDADLFSIGWRPTVSGVAAMVFAVITGWGIAQYDDIRPVRFVEFWLRTVGVRILKARSWFIRAVSIFLNNAFIAAVLVASGGLAALPWVSITVVGLTLGIAMRRLAHIPELSELDASDPPRVDGPARIGIYLNLLEVPAIIVALGLSLGQNASPNGLSAAAVWGIYGGWVAPALAVAAAGEAWWIGRMNLSHDRSRDPSTDSPSVSAVGENTHQSDGAAVDRPLGDDE